jgi:glycosyltransferase involved in cell wall biosynthesis
MRIAIDAIPLLLRSAGVKTYLLNWLIHMRRLCAPDEVLAWPFLDPREDFSHERSVAGRWGTLSRLALLHWNNCRFVPPLYGLGPRAEVFHASHQMRRPPKRCKLTATIYDMTCWLAPETHHPANVRALHRFAENVMLRADGLIAISESSRQDAIRILNLKPDKVVVIYPGVAAAYFDVTAEQAAQAALKYGLRKPYVLFVGTIEPRKNVDTLLDAWGRLPGDLRGDYKLAVVGAEGWASPRTLARLKSGEGGVRYLGYVPEPDMPGLTAGAVMLVYPSLYEGFGLPLAQAMAAGVPVVTSNVSSMPEVVGDAGLLADPRSVQEVAAAIRRLLESPDLRGTLAAKARARGARFRWEAAAQQSLEWFRAIAG